MGVDIDPIEARFVRMPTRRLAKQRGGVEEKLCHGTKPSARVGRCTGLQSYSWRRGFVRIAARHSCRSGIST